MRSTERLLDRLRAEGFTVPPGARIIRTRAGWRQRQAGAWSWYVVDADDREIMLGSPDTVRAVLTADMIHAHGDGYCEVGA